MASCITKLLIEANKEGVETLSLTAPCIAERHPAELGKEDLLFLKSDPHWTVRGTELCARHVAERIAQFHWFRRGPLKEGKQFTVDECDVPYSAGDEMASRGSRDETMHGRVLRKDGKPIDTVDAKSPILVFGDSYCRVHHEQSGDFISQLSRFTGWKIDCLFATNGGQRQVHQKLMRREPKEWAGKKLAIWLVPEQLFMPRLRLDVADLFGSGVEGGLREY